MMMVFFEPAKTNENIFNMIYIYIYIIGFLMIVKLYS